MSGRSLPLPWQVGRLFFGWTLPRHWNAVDRTAYWWYRAAGFNGQQAAALVEHEIPANRLIDTMYRHLLTPKPRPSPEPSKREGRNRIGGGATPDGEEAAVLRK